MRAERCVTPQHLLAIPRLVIIYPPVVDFFPYGLFYHSPPGDWEPVSLGTLVTRDQAAGT